MAAESGDSVAGLREQLEGLSFGQRAAFDRHFGDACDAACRWDLWGAAYLLLGGCSDDSFNDFRADLVSRGQGVFQRVLQDSDALGDFLTDIGGDESVAGVAAEVYEEEAGKPEPARRRAGRIRYPGRRQGRDSTRGRRLLPRAKEEELVGAVTVIALALAHGVANPCVDRGTVVLVETKARQLFLCEQSSPIATHPVALGWRGTGKRRRGDGKTPLGLYDLGSPRPSRKYGTFIPVEYPTAEQRRRGYTGSAIGIHGPPRETRRAGLANVADDWTLGCIAVADDETIRAVAAWVRANPQVPILLE